MDHHARNNPGNKKNTFSWRLQGLVFPQKPPPPQLPNNAALQLHRRRAACDELEAFVAALDAVLSQDVIQGLHPILLRGSGRPHPKECLS